ncbi:MAG TPA: hypothetical protein VFU63_07245, partial [Ktedonobacterales bacterium]|nr:hypothetical protein [Ktedonobacterales bacterium]
MTVSVLVMAALVAAAIPMNSAMAHGAISGTNAQVFGSHFSGEDLFGLEHSHGMGDSNGVSAAHHSAFSFSCTSYGASQGHRIVSVTQSIVNDIDSGEAGNYWAFDTVRRSITMWNVGPNQYCAIVNYYDSTFHAIAGQTSPGKGGTLTGEEYGSFAGSILYTINGTFDVSNPAAWPQFGVVNHGATTDYQCDLSGNCPGWVSFLNQYFDAGYTFDSPQWGWTYTGKDSGQNPPASAGTW